MIGLTWYPKRQCAIIFEAIGRRHANLREIGPGRHMGPAAQNHKSAKQKSSL
jgi:hypothetical protein